MSTAVLRIYPSSMHWHTISLGFENGVLLTTTTPSIRNTSILSMPRTHTEVNPLKQMARHVERRSALQMKQLYLDTLAISPTTPLPLLPDGTRFLGSRLPNCPMHVSDVSHSFSFRGTNLELCIRSY